MVKRRGDNTQSSLDIAIDSLGLKVALRPAKVGIEKSKNVMDSERGGDFHDEEVQSAKQNSPTQGTNVVGGRGVTEKEKPRRNSKAMEKSVLDDIMGDPDDFGDLDAASDSDGGRWEDTFKENVDEGADNLATALQEVTDTQKNENASPNGTPKENASMVDSSLTDCKQEPEVSEEPGIKSRKLTKESKCCKGKLEHPCNVVSTDSPSETRTQFGIRYFIIKSLSHHNIQMSIEKGIWATQVMNEPILEEAFKNSKKVILIFSVNMSGYFQGYAQMMSSVGWKRANVWSESNNGSNPWGRTFQVKWLRLYNLPFQKTVHLKNPLNDYKPVKISRDCQELAPEIGEALCRLMDSEYEFEAKQKRKLTGRDSATTKRIRRDSAYHVNWPSVQMLHPSAQHQPMRALEHFNPIEKRKERHEEEERFTGNARQGSNVVAEEDLLHMTYEEYLQKACGMSKYNGRELPSVGWGGAVADSMHDEQYEMYLASWYQNQSAMMASNIYYGHPQMLASFPAVQHP
eukprot:TRINITY_DN7347_c0_g1_i1.p1 TRINITY_DN7347_c0_g1~~TRINITY_DN7347_c0_g1_i1.p1  ORF type:complete len:516 (-),score=106.53 TRINITY_DN7347_c0_g1_i1:249-1796(-)